MISEDQRIPRLVVEQDKQEMVPEDRIRSELFVGRERELSRFKKTFTPEFRVNIVNVHTDGDGGIGKTQLLFRMQDYCASLPDDVIFTKDFIDFYDTESRSRLGVMQQIVQNLGPDNFPEFERSVEQYHETVDVSEREGLRSKIERAFGQDYAAFSARIKEQKRVIVLFFDTYEFIQRTDDEFNRAEPTEFSRWLETQLFPYLTENTCIIVSGRYPLLEIDRSQLTVEEYNLAHFALVDTKTFWKKCFNLKTEIELAEKIGTNELIETFHTLADGRPVLLALFADWVNYDRNPLSPQQLLDEIERRTENVTLPVTVQQKEIFEKALIERVATLITPEDKAVTYMALAYRRMTPEMFSFLTKNEFLMDECREILLEKLKPLSFIKYKKGDIVLLHDEMRRLVVQHWWDEQDAPRSIRREIAGEIVRYYEERFLTAEYISEAERQTYTSELLEYAFLANPQEGLERFCNEFDVALEDGKYDYANLLLREAENYQRENPHDILFPDVLEIELRRIHYTRDVEGNFSESLRRANAIIENYEGIQAWENSSVRGHFLLVKGTIAYFSGNFEEAVLSFQEAKNVFYDFGEDIWLNRTNNWLGLAFYGQGKFTEAKEWWIKGQKGFSELLEHKELDERERRRLIQGVRYSFSNLAFIYNYTGRFDISVRHAEIALDIVQHLPRNDREIARMRILTSEMLAFAGRAIDARHHAHVAERLLAQSQIRDRIWEGRLRTNLCLLQYRNNEFAYLLEYYRAEDLEEIIEHLKFVQQKDIEQARASVEKAIVLLRKKPVSPRSLSDAYYALGELYMVTPSEPDAPRNHWQKSEEAFVESLKWAKESKFLYRVVDTLESLVALYYFWNEAAGISKEVKEQNQRNLMTYREELDRYEHTMYPNLFGKYNVTLGDIEFDNALELLRSGNEDPTDFAMSPLKEAFIYYVSAAELMKTFNVNRYYLTLRVFYNRLNTLIDHIQQGTIPSSLLSRLNELQALWEGKSGEFEEIYNHVYLRIQPQKKLNDLQNLQEHLLDILGKGDFGLASLLNDCLIGAYRVLISLDTENDEYREHVIRRLNAQSGLYRTLGDEYQAGRCLADARNELSFLSDSHLKQGLEGCVDSSEGALKYRKGEYGRLLEFFLQGELSAARRRFDRQFPKDREDALKLLKRGEEKLCPAISFWEKKLTKSSTKQEKARLEGLIQRHRRTLGEARFRIGELLMLSEEFEDRGDQKGAFSYLTEAINDAEKSGDTYRCDNALESYINALYFSNTYDHPDQREKRLEYEKRLTEKLTSSGETVYTSIMSRLRIVQGDALFSSFFQRKEDPTGGYKYVPLTSKMAIRPLRTMLRYYVEACNFMAQHSAINFAAAVRFLQRRIELISDSDSLRLIQSGLRDVWSDQKYLREKTDELDTLVQFAKIRSMMLGDEKNI